MANAERGEAFTFVPRREASDRSIAFVLPDPFSDFERIGVREGERADCLQLKNNADEGEQRGKSPSLTEILPLLLFS